MRHSRQQQKSVIGHTVDALVQPREGKNLHSTPLLFWQAIVNHCTCSLWKNAYHANVNNVTSIATVYWCINVDSTFVYLGPLDFNKDSNNHICWRQMLYKGPVIIITALFSDRKTFGKSLRISVKFCHWNPKNSEILSKLRNSELTGASGRASCY